MRMFRREVKQTTVAQRHAMVFLTALLMLATSPSHAAQSKNARPSATTAKLDIVLVSPVTLKTGDNMFEVTVKEADGKPIVDAEVSVSLLLPATPATNMSEIRNAAKLKSAGGGKYTGSAIVLVAGSWDVTVSVKKEQKEIGQKKVTFAVK